VTYTNPVYPRNFPDPFVLRFRGRYHAYGTGPAGDRRFFPMLSSTDLVHWEEHGGAVEALDFPGAEEYWAPEVAYASGRFYLYYAVGRGLTPDHHLRVAVAEHPLGPWRDLGKNLTPHEIFAIDAHPFRDPRDGRWYLFYARDELEPPYAGTGIVVDRLAAMDRLEGEAQKVLRPYADWQVFELKRPVKFGLDWYTVEGPFTLRVGGRYVCFYSGGRWENPNYGVGYLLADHPLGPWIDETNREGPQVLTTAPGRVIGPGHNSVVVGPDLVTSYLVYHGWDPAFTARYPSIDRLQWIDGRPHCAGPSWEPQPAPPPADIAGWFDDADPGPEWEMTTGSWAREAEGQRAQAPHARLILREPQGDFVAETAARAAHADGGCGIALGDLEIRVQSGSLRAGGHSTPLPAGFRADAWHHLRVCRERGRLAVTVDEYPTLEVPYPDEPASVELLAPAGAVVSHFALTSLG
jgi:arabinan endo-1,5-alpha-L-arabinosidase